MRIDVSLAHRDLDAELASLHARMQRRGEALHALPTLAMHVPMPGLAVRYREVDGEFHLYVEDRARGVLAGCTVFQRVAELDRHAGRHVRSPHSRYAHAYRRRGLASALYRWALNAGLCLLSGPRQSAGAHQLWLALARSYELALVHTGDSQLRLLGPDREGRAMGDLGTRMLLLGTGWTPASATGSSAIVAHVGAC
ncbi:N-acetyltransferase [Ramlibacter algicola]|uniref:N-acetyltransferase n=1 Tax=Ramlibacter algicola TaxID=2795217 RepID=A0A934URF1_9BURK|nr:N-acetyltransferase [Ramlibacter algicola]MBK0392467.1 N-acetyltransferase [Ramlibacter algicola]